QSGEYVGIYFDQSRGMGTGRYQSQIYNCNKKYHLGTYILACDAARAYDEGARAVKGDDWKFNFSSVKSHEDVRMEEILRAHIKEYVDRAKDHQLHPIAQNNSCYIGLCKRRNRYQAALTFNKRKLCLGTYRLATDAARAYDEVTKVLRGSDAETNF
ncbi:pathogenesis-related transcription factor, partial [Thalassiosira pseudonana CCMP1335]